MSCGVSNRDICQQCFNSWKPYSYIGANITYPHRNHETRMVQDPAEQPPDDCFVIKHDNILLPPGHEPHPDPILYCFDDNSRDREVDFEHACVDP